jgi:hypothetical protein
MVLFGVLLPTVFQRLLVIVLVFDVTVWGLCAMECNGGSCFLQLVKMFEGFGTTFVYVVVRRFVFDFGVSFY